MLEDERLAFDSAGLAVVGLDAGCDLIHFDDYSVGPGYDACSVGLFREYLRTTFPQGQLAEMKLGEPDAIQPPRAGTPELVRRAWEDFSCQALAQSYYDLSRYFPAYGPSMTLGRKS